jgi:quinoprotein glucose dehydrogenase
MKFSEKAIIAGANCRGYNRPMRTKGWMGILPRLIFLLLLPGWPLSVAQTTARSPAGTAAAEPSGQWPTYGGDSGGMRYSSAAQINRDNVNQLKVAWSFHVGFPTTGSSLETTPILFKGSLYLSSPVDNVFSLDPATGRQRWVFDAHVGDTTNLAGLVASRGVASWSDSHGSGICSDRIFVGTLDARLIALDAATGLPCANFGVAGAVDLTQNVDYRAGDGYAVTSPPTVIGDVVVVGSGIEDNARVDIERGDVRGFDARSGKLLWTWEPMPWADHQKVRTGAGNTWGPIAADPEHGMIYLPTSSPSPDYYGGLRVGNNQDADSIVALDAKTGKKVWAFQVVHHDIWDYDIAAEPLLFTFRGTTPAVAVATKMGMLFVFNRLTGESLYPIHERPVPQSDVPGEVTSPTQPFPDLPPLAPLTLDLSKPLAGGGAADAACRSMIAGLRYDGIYTPVSLQGSILFPSNVGGVNWGSAAFDPVSGVLYANTNRIPYAVRLAKRPLFYPGEPILGQTLREQTLVRRSLIAAVLLLAVFTVATRGRKPWRVAVVVVLLIAVYMATSRSVYAHLASIRWLTNGNLVGEHFGKEFGRQAGSPYVLYREPLVSPHFPCGPQPWGAVSALNLNTGQAAWQTPLGTMIPDKQTGTWSVGGPIVTAGGLLFTTASQEPYLRAFNSTTGAEIWKTRTPVPSQATPMTYISNGKQYVVIADGGHSLFGTAESDLIIAYSLP